MSDHPPTLAFDLDHDVRILSAMASNLTPYLYETEMYGYLAGDLPRLTLGGLLMRLHRLQCLEDHLDAEQEKLVTDAQLNFEAERTTWAVHYENKIEYEITARLTALERFLAECGEDPAGCAANYPAQAEKRTIIRHLQAEAQEHNLWTDEHTARLRDLDRKQQRVLQEGPFIYTDERLTAAYPRDTYWWLYGFLPEEAPHK